MKRTSILAAAVAATAMTVLPASAETFRFAFQGDAQGLDPHSYNETFTLGFLGNVYEGLTKYDENLKLEPALATSWETVNPTTWRVELREGVTFHNGNRFNADDVIFSWERTLTPGSDQKNRGSMITEINKIDDYTIEFTTAGPLPVIMQELTFLYIMDKEWSEANDALQASDPSDTNSANFAASNANGTGPFRVVDRQPGVRTGFERHADYWDADILTNVTKVEFTPVKEAATRVAALISGQLDLVFPVPVQDWSRLDNAQGVRAMSGPEARTIFLGVDQIRDELLYSSVKGKNPFKDIRVRQALAHAIILDAIDKKIMRGAATPTGLLVAPQINGHDASLNTPYAYDPDKSRELLAEAGYPDGFEVTLECPNNRYVNDEKICQAVASMATKVGIKTKLSAMPKAQYFAKVMAQNGYETSFFMLGWTPGSIDAHNVFQNLLACRGKEAGMGPFNFGGYCNERVHEIAQLIGSETDPAKRNALISEGFMIAQDEYAYFPLHQQPLSWGASEKVQAAQRADNVLDFRDVVINP